MWMVMVDRFSMHLLRTEEVGDVRKDGFFLLVYFGCTICFCSAWRWGMWERLRDLSRYGYGRCMCY